MSEPDDEEVLEAIRKRRIIREIRNEAIEVLRWRSTRSVSGAILLFAYGLAIFVGYMWLLTSEEEFSELITIFGVVAPLLLFLRGLRCLLPDPCDRLLLLLAKEAVLQDELLTKPGNTESQPREER